MRLRWTALFAAFTVLTACTDYEFTPMTEPDTGPERFECPAEQAVPFAPAATLGCEQEAVVGSFTPVVEWEWRNNPLQPEFKQIMATPVVGNLTDDDGDGDVDEFDIPDVVFTAFSGGSYGSAGAIVALTGDTGATMWSQTSIAGHQPYASSGIAIGDLDGTGMVILVSATDGLLCLNADGSFRWHASVQTDPYGHPSIADLDGDGIAEVVFGRSVVNADGSIRWSLGGASRQDFAGFAMDLEGDGLMEIITGSGVLDALGNERWNDGDSGWPAVGDIDGDGLADVVRVHSGRVSMTSAEGVRMWDSTLTDGGGGPPTVADFDGDGLAEIGVASREVYRVLDGDGSQLWANVVQDYSSSVTGSSVFDFEGDGAAEVVYADEETLWVYDGATGAVEMAWATHSSGTLFEYPLVVDIDRDGSAEIVVASNDYSSHNDSRGITVVGDADGTWSAARPIWNQHAYSVNNINDDGTVPSAPTPNWLDRNSFRAGNSETRTGLAQADLTVGAPDTCIETCGDDIATLYIPIANTGESMAADVSVALYRRDGATTTLVEVRTIGDLYAGSVATTPGFEVHRSDFGTHGLTAVVDDDGTGTGANQECVEDNNAWSWPHFPCD